MINNDLFSTSDRLFIEQDSWLFKGYATQSTDWILERLREILRLSPLRQMQIPGGHRMSVRTSSCGSLGWISDLSGYRYSDIDPMTGRPWPEIPAALLDLVSTGAAAADYPGFIPDSCLINCYRPGAKMGLHQDKDEQDRSAPIVSLSFGLPVTFMFGGLNRRDPVKRFPLEHGDMLVWGGASRMVYHGVAPLAQGEHPALGALRLNLTFRRAGGKAQH